MKTLKLLSFFTVVVLAFMTADAAELSFARHYSNDMVLQRDKPIVIRGLAENGAEVTVTFGADKSIVKADETGQWVAALKPVAANAKAQALTATSGGKTVTINAVVGDVFLVARQTSIDITLGRDAAGRDIASKHKPTPMFRAISISTKPAGIPQPDLDESATKGWSIVDNKSALAMTAASFYLGRDLAATVDVPVGIIDLNLGSAFPLSWMSRESLEETEKFYGDKEVMGQVSWHDKALEAEQKGVPMSKKQKTPPVNTVQRTLFPSGGYNAVLHPMRDFALKGLAVQLGNDYPYMIYQERLDSEAPFDTAELNTAYVETYNIRKVGFRMESKTTPRIAREWRKYLGDEALPVGLIVPPGSELNTLGEHHREMRELQRLTAEEVPNVSIILPGSENIPFSAQPEDEELLAKRAFIWALGSAYGKTDIAATGPLFERMEANFNEATVYFKEGTAKGLKATKQDALNYFEVANVEGDYAPAKATIDGEAIKLESDTVTRIVRVRYNWNKRPNQDLVNAAGLPAVPFRSEKLPYHWFVTNSDDDLPEEYFTPANEWKKNDVTLINAQLKTIGYDNFTGWIGPAGFKTGPFGPNMGVREIKKGSPADGKLLVGDIIYSANGNMLGEKAWEVMGNAITQSETRASKGKLVLGVRRGTENIDIELTLEVMGSYSATAPYDCPKTDKIVKQLEEVVIAGGADPGFLNYDAIFLLATGDPEMLGYVRRGIYRKNDKRDPNRPIDTAKEGKSWHNSADAFWLGEYYLATGDRNVLPHLKHACDRLAATQNPEYGGWRQNFPGGATYGLIPNAGLPGVMGWYFADQAGLDIDRAAYAKGIKHYSGGKAETGYLIYGYGECRREVPTPIDPDKMAGGKLDSFNGGISCAGILMRFVENHRAAHLCSMISAYSFNNTFGGHGGNFWNNFWTPLGAHQHSKKAFIHFWKNHRWYRECSRMYDGSLIGGGRQSAGYGVALVAPFQRIQITGAPTSPFSVNAPKELAPALQAYWAKDYAGCEKIVAELIAAGTVGKDDMPTVKYLADTARIVRESIDADFARMDKLMKDGNPAEAKSFLPGLKGIMAENDPRLAKMEADLGSVQPAPAPPRPKKQAATTENTRNWQCLVMERGAEGKKAKGPKNTALLDQPSTWKISVVEDMSQAPVDWTKPEFDDRNWMETTLPMSWRMYHTALLRTKFNVDDPAAFDALRLRAWVFRQQGIEIYLNGELIGKINNIEKKTGDIENEFKSSALKHLRQGENTLAVTTRHNWRWGMLFMKVYNDGFDFNLDAALKND